MKMRNVKTAFMMACMSLFMLVSVSSFAQEKMQHKTPEEKAKMMSDKMKTELTLSDEQYQKVQTINLDFANKTSAVPKDGDKSAWMSKMKECNEARSKSLKEVLTPDQFTKYETIKKEMRGKIKDKEKA
jgi:methionine-rich copper-binding protein CopC